MLAKASGLLLSSELSCRSCLCAHRCTFVWTGLVCPEQWLIAQVLHLRICCRLQQGWLVWPEFLLTKLMCLHMPDGLYMTCRFFTTN